MHTIYKRKKCTNQLDYLSGGGGTLGIDKHLATTAETSHHFNEDHFYNPRVTNSSGKKKTNSQLK